MNWHGVKQRSVEFNSATRSLFRPLNNCLYFILPSYITVAPSYTLVTPTWWLECVFRGFCARSSRDTEVILTWCLINARQELGIVKIIAIFTNPEHLFTGRIFTSSLDFIMCRFDFVRDFIPFFQVLRRDKNEFFH